MASTTPTSSSSKSKVWSAILTFVIANWSYILLAGTAIVGTIGAVNYFKDKQTIGEYRKIQKWNDSVSNSKIVYYKDAYDREHARAENLAVHDAAMQDYADSVAKAVKVKPSQVASVVAIGGKASIKVSPTIDSVEKEKIPCKGDTVEVTKAFDYHWNDPWTSITGRVGYGAINQLQVDMTDTIKVVDYWKRSWFLGSKHYYADILNTNPHVHVTGYKGVQLASETEAEKQWAFGPIIGGGYSPGTSFNKPTFFVGVGVMYIVKKF